MNGRVVLAVVLLLGGTGIAVAGAAPQSTLTPSSATDAEPGDASVKGMVVEVDGRNRTFVLTDGDANLTVRLDGSLPAAVQPDRSIVAKGTLVLAATDANTDAGADEDGRAVLEADEVLVGCPSKYQA